MKKRVTETSMYFTAALCLYSCTEMNLQCWLTYNSKMQISTEHLTQLLLSKTDTVHNACAFTVCVSVCGCLGGGLT